MDDKKLHALLTAIDAGSLSKAASILGYTQAGLTQMMNSLEDELGCPVLVRNYNGIKLTSVGEQLYPYISEADNSLRKLKEAAVNCTSTQNKSIRIGIYPSITKSWLPIVLKEYEKVNPGTAMEITVGGEEIPQLLENGVIDIAIAEESRKANYKWTPIFEDSYFAIVPKTCALATKESVHASELVTYPLILSQYNELKEKLRAVINEPIKEHIQINSDDDDGLISLVEQGLGVSILPKTSLKDVGASISVIELAPPLKRTIGIMTPRSTRKQVNEFVSFAKHFDFNKYEI